MGEEISHEGFSAEDHAEFLQRLRQETDYLRDTLSSGGFSSAHPRAGFEIEAWLVDDQCRPAPVNKAFLETFDSPLASPELATFNIELNNTPRDLSGEVFGPFQAEMSSLLKRADEVAAGLDADLLLTGILPTATPDDFSTEFMSDMNRYRVLNEQVLEARQHRPLHFDIDGREPLELLDNSVMLESATTSFQLHLQSPAADAHHYYNAALIASAATVAIAANAPLFFGHLLWEETRIPVFEQSVNPGRQFRQRVTFGSDYAYEHIAECFIENLEAYPTLLPELFETDTSAMRHLRLHNGVVWRWNRPLIGFDPDGTPHFRIEHRPLPAGPTLLDMLANACFFYGLAHSLMERLRDGMALPAFDITKQNFYAAAKQGLSAEVDWLGSRTPMQTLIGEQLVNLAQQGLDSLGVASDDYQPLLDIIADRNQSGCTGAHWQRHHLKTVDGDLHRLSCDYLQRQRSGSPVHLWTH